MSLTHTNRELGGQLNLFFFDISMTRGDDCA
jgi:hypothetical protein